MKRPAGCGRARCSARGPPPTSCGSGIRISPAEAFEAATRRIDAAFHAHGEYRSVLVPGAEEVLTELAEMGIAMGVATNDATEAAVAAIAALGLDAYLPHVFGYDSVRAPETGAGHRARLRRALRGVDPSDIAVVGDNRYDMEMARAAGAGAAVGVLTGNSNADDLAAYADVVLPSIRELPGWLRRRSRDSALGLRPEIGVEHLFDRKGTSIRDPAAWKLCILKCLQSRFPILNGQAFRRHPCQARTVLNDALDPVAMLIDRGPPAGLPFLRFVAPLDEVEKNDLEVALEAAPIAPSQALDLLGEMFPVDVPWLEGAKTRRLVL